MNRHVPPHDLEPDEALSFLPSRPAPDFKTAARHSARVRWIKRLLPAVIALALLVIAGASFVSQMEVKLALPFDLGRLTLNGSRLTMELPKLSGFTDDNRGYSVNAKVAVQDVTHPDLVELSDIEARLELADKGWAALQATKGTIDTKTQFVKLTEGVELSMNGGYGGRLENADVDVKAGSISTDKPVLFTYLDGRLVANRLTVTDRGTRALFEGNVELNFRLNSLPGQTSGSAAPLGDGVTVTGSVPQRGTPQAGAPVAETSVAPSGAQAAPLPTRRPAVP